MFVLSSMLYSTLRKPGLQLRLHTPGRTVSFAITKLLVESNQCQCSWNGRLFSAVGPATQNALLPGGDVVWQVISEKMGLEAGWNYHICVQSGVW